MKHGLTTTKMKEWKAEESNPGRTYAWTSVATGAVIIGGFILVYSTIALAVVVKKN